MYYREHGCPHFHAQYGKHNAVFDINTGGKITGKFPKLGEKIVQKWARQYRGELLDNWTMLRTKGAFRKIQGADK